MNYTAPNREVITELPKVGDRLTLQTCSYFQVYGGTPVLEEIEVVTEAETLLHDKDLSEADKAYRIKCNEKGLKSDSNILYYKILRTGKYTGNIAYFPRTKEYNCNLLKPLVEA